MKVLRFIRAGILVVLAVWLAWQLLSLWLGRWYLATENRNFAALRKRSELNCETMPFHCAARDGNVNALAELKSRGMDINAKDLWGRTAILYSVGWSTSAARALITLGADLNMPDVNGDLPLYSALRQRNFPLAKALVDGGADPDARIGSDRKKMTLLTEEVTQKNAEAASFLVQQGARLALKDDYGYNACERAALYKTTSLFPFCAEVSHREEFP